MVLEVLGEVAVLARGLDLAHDVRPAVPDELCELALDLGQPLLGDGNLRWLHHCRPPGTNAWTSLKRRLWTTCETPKTAPARATAAIRAASACASSGRMGSHATTSAPMMAAPASATGVMMGMRRICLRTAGTG